MAKPNFSFEQRWHRHDGVILPSLSEPEEKWCTYAKQYGDWIERISKDILDDPDFISLNQLKVRIGDRFFELFHSMPQVHRNRIGGSGHVCVFHVYERIHRIIMESQWSLMPPPIHIPPELPATPPPPPLPQIMGITLGEMVDEADATA